MDLLISLNNKTNLSEKNNTDICIYCHFQIYIMKQGLKNLVRPIIKSNHRHILISGPYYLNLPYAKICISSHPDFCFFSL